MSDDLRQRMERRLGELKQERETYIPHWQELSRFIAPRVGKYQIIDTSRGGKKNDAIINSHASTALRTLKSGFHAGMTSQSRPWFRLVVQDDPELSETGAVKDWLFAVENSMRIIFSRSNFYNAMPSLYGVAASHGTACMAVLEDHDSVIRCYPYPIGSYLLGLNDRLKIDTMYRELPLTVRQMVMQFGLDNVSSTVRSAWDRGSYDQAVEVCHAVEPNPERDLGKLDAKNKPWRSVYWERGSQDQTFLRESGFDEFPIVAPRWDVEGDDVYGFGPGMDALGLVKGLQFYEQRKAEAIDKLVRPPMLADTTLRNQKTSLLPGGVTYIDNLAQQSHAGYRPVYQFNPNTAELRADISEIKQEISKIFFEDLMLMFAQSDLGQVTAREVEERHQEKLLVLGPTIERFGEEIYDPVIDRTFAIMLRRGLVPPPPPQVQGRALKVEYISVMAQAQKLVHTASMERVAGFVGNLASLNPAALDKLNTDAAIDEYAEMHGIPPNVINTDDEVAAIREERAKQAQAQQMMAMAPAMNQAATAAKTLSDTNVDETSALTRLLGIA